MTTQSNESKVWHDGIEAAVSVRFDDGLDSHLDVAIPLLDAHGFRGTFYLCPSGPEAEWLERAKAWRPAVNAGHEIGNHTMMHPIPRALADQDAPFCYENLTTEAYAADVDEADRRLNAAFGPGERTFCYPCYQTEVGKGRHRRSLVPLIAERFVAATAGGEISRPYNVPGSCDLHVLLSVRADRLNADEMIAHVERAADSGRWIILMFHDIGDGRLPTPRPVFEALLDHLERHRGRLWTAPVLDVARHIRDKSPRSGLGPS